MIGLLRIMEAVQKAAHDHGIERLAALFDRKPSTLYSELNYHLNEQRNAKLGLLDAVRIMQATGDHAGLHAIAAALGYTCTKIAAEPALEPGNTSHVRVMDAVVQFLAADAQGEDYVRLHAKLESATSAMESVWTAKRAQHVSFSLRPLPGEAVEAEKRRRPWWKRWGGL